MICGDSDRLRITQPPAASLPCSPAVIGRLRNLQ